MEPWLIAVAIKPLVLFALSALVLYPARKLTEKYLPDGKLKRILLFRTNEIESYRRRSEPKSVSGTIITRDESREPVSH